MQEIRISHSLSILIAEDGSSVSCRRIECGDCGHAFFIPLKRSAGYQRKRCTPCMIQHIAQYHVDPYVRARRKLYLKRYHRKPEVRAHNRLYMKQYRKGTELGVAHIEGDHVREYLKLKRLCENVPNR